MWTALPSGSKIAAISCGTPLLWIQMLDIGRTTYSAKAPSRLTPTPSVWAQRCRRAGEAVAGSARRRRGPPPLYEAGRWNVGYVLSGGNDLADELMAYGEAFFLMVEWAQASQS